MPRGEAPLPKDGVPALVDLARTLRSVRGTAGLTLTGLADAVAFSRTTLSTATAGRRLPTWEVTWAYASACDTHAEEREWRERWERAHRAVKNTGTDGTDKGGAPSGRAAGPAPIALVAEFAQLLGDVVRTSGMSQRQVAARAGYAPGTLSRDTRGRALPPWNRVRDVLQAAGISPSEIEEVWSARWRRAQDAAGRNPASADAAAVPPWYAAVRAAARRRLVPQDPMSGQGHNAPWIDVRWSAAGAHLQDDWNLISGQSDASVPSLGGRGADITDVYLVVPSGRLIVLGSAGAGASNLARRLGLGLVERAESTMRPVPLLLPLMTWTGGPLQTWIDQHAARAFGPEAVQHLEEHHLLLPILDGLHDLGFDRRVEVVEEVNAFDAGRPVVLTSRMSAYTEVVERSRTVIGRSAAVHVQPLGAAELAAFLPAGAAREGRSWQNVIDALDAGDPRTAHLQDVCATPLLAATARRRYLHAYASPDTLLDRELFPDAAALRTHLVKHHLAVRYGAQEATDGPAPIGLVALHAVLTRAAPRANDRLLIAPTAIAPASRGPAVACAVLVLMIVTVVAGVAPAFFLVLLPLLARAAFRRRRPRSAYQWRRRDTGARLPPPVPGRAVRPSPMGSDPPDLWAAAGVVTAGTVLSGLAVSQVPHPVYLANGSGFTVACVGGMLCAVYLVLAYKLTRPVDDTHWVTAPVMFADDAKRACLLTFGVGATAAIIMGVLTLSPAVAMTILVDVALLGLAPSVGVRYHVSRFLPTRPLWWVTHRERLEREIAATWEHLSRVEQTICDHFGDPLARDPRILIGRAVGYPLAADLQILLSAVCVGVLVPVGGAFRLSHPALAEALPIGPRNQYPVGRLASVLARRFAPLPESASWPSG